MPTHFHGGQDDRGASAVEYALIMTGIAMIIFLSVFIFGGGVRGLFDNTCESIESQGAADCTT